LQGYLGNVSHVDHAVGELLTWLDENDLSKNTIVVYSSDHGEYVCEHGIMEKSPGICSDAVTRIPMIWRWPEKFKTGHVAEEIVEAVDFINTLCSLVGIDKMETSDGSDISPLLYGYKDENNERIGVTENVWSKSIRKGPYRLVYYPKDMFSEEYPAGFGELYHLKDDPWEMTNLFFDTHYSDVVSELKDALFDWLVTTTRPVTVQPGITKETNQSKMYHHNVVNSDGKVNPALVRNIKNKNYK
jgi:arylsulfatase A-like enzyme